MPSIETTRVIDPRSLSASEREQLISDMYAVHSEIFDGVSRDDFAHYVVESTAEDTKIQVMYGDDRQLAGYVAAHSFRRKLRGELVAVNRAEAGLRRQYRGNSTPMLFLIQRMIKTRWDFPGPQYYLGCLVHPSSYSAFARTVPTLYPAADVEIPPEIYEFMLKLADEFHLPMVDPQRPLVRQVGWITRDTEAERRYWQACDLPAPRYYLEQNPTYGAGHGLLTMFPIDTLSVAQTALNIGTARVKKTVQRAVGALERSVLKPRLDAFSAEDLLATAEELTGLNLDAVRQHGLLGTRHPLAARSVLMRAGQHPDAIYAVTEGSLFVLAKDQDGEEIVLDQLGPGALIGEMELLTGRELATTIRAATDAVLLKLTERDLGQLLTLEPRLEHELWLRVCGRVFAHELRLLPALSQLSRAQQEAWFATARALHLAEAESERSAGASTLVLALGRLRVECGAQHLTLSAPALVELPAAATVTALENSRCALLAARPAQSPSPSS